MESQRKFVVSPECNYMKREEGQVNGYYIDEKLCCMCGKGTKWAGDCNSTYPESTVCIKCHFNPVDKTDRYHMDWEPHVQRECYQQLSSCTKPKVLIEGSTTNDARCVCPDGMIEKHGRCFEGEKTTSKPKTPRPSVRTTTLRSTQKPSTTTAKPTRTTTNSRTTKSLTTKPRKSIAPSKVLEPIIRPATLKPNSTSQGSIANLSNANITEQGLNAGQITGIACGIGIAFIIFIIIILAYKFYKSYKHSESKGEGNDNSGSATPTYTSKDDLVEIKIHGGKMKIGEDDPRAVNCSYQGTPEMINKAAPMARCRPEIILHQDEERERLLQNNVAVGNQDLNNILEQIPREMYKDLALDLATKWGSIIHLTQIRPVFRKLFSTKQDALIDSLEKQYSSSHGEFVYQLMRCVYNNLGRKLTPQYILERLAGVDPYPGDLIQTTQDFFKSWWQQHQNQNV